jgi:hypothetical protein
VIAQLVLSGLLVGMLAYAVIAARRTRFVSTLIGLAALAGLYFVWQPDSANRLANDVGIGRGADLILYVWVILSMLVGLNLHLRLRTQAEQTTRLARTLAILEARKANDEANSADR